MIYLRYGGEKNEKADRRETTIYRARWKVFRVIVYAEKKKLDCWRQIYIILIGIWAMIASIVYIVSKFYLSLFFGSPAANIVRRVLARGLRISLAQFRRVMAGRRSLAIRHEGCVSLAINPTGTCEGCACVRKYNTSSAAVEVDNPLG